MTEPKASSHQPIKGLWNDQKVKLKAKYEQLTDEDLHFEEGKKDEMLNHLQIKLGKTRHQLSEILVSL